MLAQKTAREGMDKPPRETPVGLILVLETTGGLIIVPMKLLDLWQGWAKHRGLDPHPTGEITEPPAVFVTDALALIRSEQDRGRSMNGETEQLASRDFWCEWGSAVCLGSPRTFSGLSSRTNR